MQSPCIPSARSIGKRSAGREQAQYDPEEHEAASGGPHVASHPRWAGTRCPSADPDRDRQRDQSGRAVDVVQRIGRPRSGYEQDRADESGSERAAERSEDRAIDGRTMVSTTARAAPDDGGQGRRGDDGERGSHDHHGDDDVQSHHGT